MDTILNITLGYLFVGTFALPTVVLLEVIQIHSKDVRFQDWLKRVLGESEGPVPWQKTVWAFLRWPLFVLMFIIAWIRGKTLLEYVAEGIERKQEKAEKEREDTLAMIEGKIPLGRGWTTVTPEMDGIKALYFYRAVYTNRDPIITHLVVEVDGGFTCWRVIDENCEHNLPLCVALKLKEAKRECIQDAVWLALCQPGLEEDLHRFWSDEIARFEEEAELDRLAGEVIEEQDLVEVTLDDAYTPGEGTTIKTDDPD